MNDLPGGGAAPEMNIWEKLHRIFRVFHLELELAREQTVKFSTCVALRGLLGNMMHKYAPPLLSAVLKPDEKGHAPSLLMLKLDSPCAVSQKICFTVVLADPSGELTRKTADLIRERFPGESFAGVPILKAAPGEPFIPPVFAPDSDGEDLFSVELDIFAPVRIKRHGVITDARSFSLAFMVSALIERYNVFLKNCGEKEYLESAPLIEKAALALVRKKEIRYQTQQRRSGHTADTVYLSGCTGELAVSHIPAELVRLLYLGSFTGAGRHTSAGSGMYRIKAERMK